MRLDYALLASSADAAGKGLVHILGANISTWNSAVFPTDASLVFLAKIDFDAEEFKREYLYHFQICGPNAEHWERLTPDFKLTCPVREDRPELGTSMVVMSRVNARLPDAGDYAIRLTVNGEEVARRPLYVTNSTTV